MTIAGHLRGPVQLALILLTSACASTPSTRADLRRIEPTLAPLPSDVAAPRETEAPTFDGALPGYLGYAFAHNPGLRARFETWRAATHRPAQARKLPEPTVTYAAFVRSVETRVGPQRHRLGVSQWFPWPTTLKAGSEAAQREAEAAMRLFEAHALQVGADVATAYWAVWRLERERDVLREEVEVLTSLSEQVRVRVEVGGAELADLARIDLTLARTKDRNASLAEHVRIARAGLRRALGIADAVPTPVLPEAPMAEPLAEDPARLVAELHEHPEVVHFVAQSEAAAQRQKRARAQRAPSFGLGVDWILTGPSSMDPAPSASGQDAVAVSLSMKVPLWSRAYAAGEREARAQGAAARARALEARNGLAQAVTSQAARLRDDVRRVAVHDSTLIPQAEAAFESVLASYASGRANVSDLLLAERDLLALRRDRFVAQADYATHLAQLERVVGRPVRVGPQGDSDD